MSVWFCGPRTGRCKMVNVALISYFQIFILGSRDAFLTDHIMKPFWDPKCFQSYWWNTDLYNSPLLMVAFLAFLCLSLEFLLWNKITTMARKGSRPKLAFAPSEMACCSRKSRFVILVIRFPFCSASHFRSLV